MSGQAGYRACPSCLRRSWLLGLLAVRVECRWREDPDTLAQMLALGDGELIEAIAGRRKQEFQQRYAEFGLQAEPGIPGVQSLCPHERRETPQLAGGNFGLDAVFVAGGEQRLLTALERPVVAIVGTGRPTDYGVQMAMDLARNLSACGLTVAGAARQGVGRAVLAGGLKAGGDLLAVSAGGVDVAAPAHIRALQRAVVNGGCVISRMPCGLRAHRWCGVVSSWLLASLAQLVIVVEADDSVTELAAASAAEKSKRLVAAVPGRVSSPVSKGCHSLLRNGAHLVEDASEVLDLLHAAMLWRAPEVAPAQPRLEPRLQRLLDRVGGGEDTLGQLLDRRFDVSGGDAHEVLLALAELELAGRLSRGEGGRYVVCDETPSV